MKRDQVQAYLLNVYKTTVRVTLRNKFEMHSNFSSSSLFLAPNIFFVFGCIKRIASVLSTEGNVSAVYFFYDTDFLLSATKATS